MKNLLFILLINLITYVSVFGQGDAPCDPFTDPFCSDPPPEEQIPIDGGITFLAMAGVAWGIKKLRE